MGIVMKKKSLTNTVNFLKKHNSDRNMKFNSEGERIETKKNNAYDQAVFYGKEGGPAPNRNSLLIKATTKGVTQTRQRSSVNTAIKDVTLRKAVINSIITKLLFSDITQGNALIQLRIEVLGLNQEKYAKLVNVSRKKLSDIENNKGNSSVEVLNKVFKPFGLNVGLIPISGTVLKSILDDNDDFTKYLPE